MESKCITYDQLAQELNLLRKEVLSLKEATERQVELEDTLDFERELYLDLTNALPMGIYRLRVFHEMGTEAENWYRKDNEPYKIDFVNDRFCEILNIDKKKFIRNPALLHDLIHEDDKAEFVRKNVEANVHLLPFMWEGRFKCRGEIIWAHFESIPRQVDNNDIIWTGILNDITAVRKAEEQLQLKNEELLRLNGEKDKFLSIIAHDLKSPFNSIIGFSGLLLEKALQKDVGKLQEYASIINSSSQKTMNLLMNLIQWTQSQSGHMHFNPEYFNLAEVITETTDLFSNILSQKSISVMREVPTEVPVFADKAMIATIVRNLLSNAIKFTTEEGSVHLAVRESPDEITVQVMDSGKGMEKSALDKLFHIDSNYTTPDTQGNKGTGLGLILCKEFTDRHGGTIGVDSELGKGSVFYFTIPLKRTDGLRD